MTAAEDEQAEGIAVDDHSHKQAAALLKGEIGETTDQEDPDYGKQPGACYDHDSAQGHLNKRADPSFTQDPLQLKTNSSHGYPTPDSPVCTAGSAELMYCRYRSP